MALIAQVSDMTFAPTPRTLVGRGPRPKEAIVGSIDCFAVIFGF